MKKFTLFLFAMMISFTAQASGPFKVARNIKPLIIKKEASANPMSKSDMQRNRLKAPARVITEQPEGELVNYIRSGEAIYIENGYITTGQQSGTVSIVYPENSKTVYIKNLLYKAGSYFDDSWVTGTISDDGTTLSVPTEQSIYYSEDYSADVNLAWGTTSVVDNYIAFTKDSTVTEITYTIDAEAKTITLNNSSGDINAESPNNYCATGLSCYWTDDLSFGGFIEWKTVFTEGDIIIPDVITEQPEGTLTEYYRSGASIMASIFGIQATEQDGKLNVVINPDSTKAYIQNPSYNYTNNNWVEGDFNSETGLITIPTGQYINYYSDNFYGIQMMWGKSNVSQENDTTYTFNYEVLDENEIYFQIDGDTIKLLNSVGDINADFPDNYVATGIIFIWDDDQSFNSLDFNTKGVHINAFPAVPADPTADNWDDFGDESGFSKFYYTLPTTDVDGNMLDPEHLSYSIFTDDDQLFTFDAESYTYDLTEDITEVPYSLYSNAVDFKDSFTYFYRTNAEGYTPLFNERIGIQVYYTVNEEKNASNIVYWPDVPTAINGVNTNKQEVSTTYYDISGRQVSKPVSGMYVKVVRYADGSVNTKKVLR